VERLPGPARPDAHATVPLDIFREKGWPSGNCQAAEKRCAKVRKQNEEDNWMGCKTDWSRLAFFSGKTSSNPRMDSPTDITSALNDAGEDKGI